jgi:hypothetical protein
MKTNYYSKLYSVLLIISTALFSSCQKDILPEAEPTSSGETVSTVPRSVSSIALATTSTSNLVASSAMQLGINGHMGDAPYLATPPATQIQMLKARGMTWYRLNIQTTSDGSASSSTLLDALQAAATSGGVKILPMLYPRTLDYSLSESASYNAGKTLGANFAAKYGRYFTHYNLGNDLELPLLLSGKTGQSQADYNKDKFNVLAAYLKGMDAGIKLKDVGAKTMISAGWLHYGFLRMCDWYGVKFDVVAYNWYSDMENAAPKSPYYISDISVKLSSLFPDKDIWFTEFNYRYKSTLSTTENEQNQNTFVTNFVAKVKKNPKVKVAMVYELFDEPYKSTQESKYGVLKWTTTYTSWAHKILSKTLTGSVTVN